MKKTLRDLTTDLQTICHNGMSNCRICVKVMDAIYDIGKIEQHINNSGNEKQTIFMINTEILNGGDK